MAKRHTKLNRDFNLNIKVPKWYSLPGQKTLDSPVYNVPESITKYFDNYITAGFVKIESNYFLEPHEDSVLENISEKYRDTLGDEYIDWLQLTGSRKCALMIPFKGDFVNTTTDLYWKNTKELFESFTLDKPVLFQTGGDTLHSVNNKEERITFQLSFKETYEDIRHKISALGFA